MPSADSWLFQWALGRWVELWKQASAASPMFPRELPAEDPRGSISEVGTANLGNLEAGRDAADVAAFHSLWRNYQGCRLVRLWRRCRGWCQVRVHGSYILNLCCPCRNYQVPVRMTSTEPRLGKHDSEILSEC